MAAKQPVTKTVNKKEVAVKAIVAKNTANALATEASNPANWGMPKDLTAKDIMIPKILVMQAMSKPVTSGEAKFGEFRESLNGTVIGDVKKPIQFIPFYRSLEYVVMRKDKGTYMFNRSVPITSQNDNEEFEQEHEGHEEKWYRTTNFYVLRPEEVEAGGALPYLLSFKSSSARAGTKITTTMYMKNIKPRNAPEHEKTPAGTVLELSGTKKTNDKGTFVVMDVKEIRPSTEAEVAEAFSWAQTVMKGAIKVDHSDLEKEVNDVVAEEELPDSDRY